MAAACLLAVLVGGGLVFADWWGCLPDDLQATYVGRSSCAECHQEAAAAWQGSHHDLAMDLATPETVLGDFNDAEFEHHGIRSRMFRRDGKYWVHTEGPDGKMADFEVKYTLGVDPLQNYMVEFDRPPDQPEHEVARVQVLRLTWDTPPPKVVLHAAPGRAGTPGPGRRPALDGHRPAVEQHVRRLPLDGRRQELRPGEPDLPHHVLRDRRQLRSLPWAVQHPRPAGPQPLAVLGPQTRPGPGAVEGQRRARRSRPAPPAIRGGGSWPPASGPARST